MKILNLNLIGFIDPSLLILMLLGLTADILANFSNKYFTIVRSYHIISNSTTIVRNSFIDTSITIGLNLSAIKLGIYAGLIIGAFSRTAITVFVLEPATVLQIENIQNLINILYQEYQAWFEEFDGVSSDITHIEGRYGPGELYEDEDREALNELHENSERLLRWMARNMRQIRRLEADIRALDPDYVSSIEQEEFEEEDYETNHMDSPRGITEEWTDASSESGYESE